VQVLGVNYQDGLDAAKAFAAENGVAWPSVVDDGPIGAAYEVPGLPATYLIDAQGRIVERLLGEVTEEQLEERIKVLTA
jgi:peroxiredoxin